MEKPASSHSSDAVLEYVSNLPDEWSLVSKRLTEVIYAGLPQATAKVWHRHPVWFDGKNPLTGFSLQKAGLRWMFWSGMSFDEPDLIPGKGRFQDASVFLQPDSVLDPVQTARWLDKAWNLQWNYAEIVRNKGVLLPLKGVG